MTESKCRKDENYKTEQSEISGLWVLERDQGKGMEMQTAQRFTGKIQTDTEKVDEQESEHGICGKGAAT